MFFVGAILFKQKLLSFQLNFLFFALLLQFGTLTMQVETSSRTDVDERLAIFLGTSSSVGPLTLVVRHLRKIAS